MAHGFRGLDGSIECTDSLTLAKYSPKAPRTEDPKSLAMLRLPIYATRLRNQFQQHSSSDSRRETLKSAQIVKKTLSVELSAHVHLTRLTS